MINIGDITKIFTMVLSIKLKRTKFLKINKENIFLAKNY